jgi:hypothetical protein
MWHVLSNHLILLDPMRTLWITAVFAACLSLPAFAQQELIVKGVVAGGDGEHVFYDLMIVNRRTRTGLSPIRTAVSAHGSCAMTPC